jgi:mono/diheme cytochrome c family protein
MFDFVGVAILILLTVLFGWLLTRAWGSKNAILKWVGSILTGLLTLLSGLLLVLGLIGFYKLNARHANPVADITVAGTPEQIARGERFAQFCAGCHSPNAQPPLVGQDFLTDGPPAGTLYAANLTPAGELKDWSDGEIIRAIREGVHKNGRSLLIMPSNIFHNLSDDDVQAIVAYLRAQPAAEPATPPARLNIVGAILINIAPLQTAQEPITGPVPMPPEGPTAEYGEYLVSIVACHECHGENLTGGTPSAFGPPPGPNLTQIVPNWSEDEFLTFFRTGTDPSGRAIDPEMMPWKEYSNFATDDDLKAIYNYVHGLTPTQ